MQHPERKYQLFPKDKQGTASSGKALDPGQAFALAMSQNGEKGDKMAAGAGLRIRIKEHNLIRRRKISVPELGPMTTVQEVTMDSRMSNWLLFHDFVMTDSLLATIPGRPPVHERSISAPGNAWKPYSIVTDPHVPVKPHYPEGKPELLAASRSHEELQRPQAELRQPLSPKSLAPLVIPTTNSSAPRLTRQLSLNRLRSGSTPVEVAIRSAKTDDSPRARTPFTPLSAAVTTPRSAATTAATTSTLPTPLSAPVEARESPKPWEKPANYTALGTREECALEASDPPKTGLDEPTTSVRPFTHRRHQSESASIMERGRPRKRSEIIGVAPVKRTGSKRSKSSERRAFEQLPKGWKASDAVNMLSPTEVGALSRQAIQQASRFEVLRKEDVDNLSRVRIPGCHRGKHMANFVPQELRQLDERTEYLRRTYTSLRAGRRNLHTRICQYLRSPRTAKFSPDSMLKQEEALAELDSSIDEWVNKLEHAENRRTRVRQKLLEHVAAAVTLGSPTGGVVGVSETLQLAMGVRPLNPNISTPPRSPAKPTFSPVHTSSSPSPQRVVAHVPSTILEQPLFEEAATMDSKEPEPGAPLRRAETIRIYADNDVYALFADVENTISNMGGTDVPPKEEQSQSTDAERRKPYRTLSHDTLNGSPARKPLPISKFEEKPSSSPPPAPAPGPAPGPAPAPASAPTPPAPEPATEEIYLTSAVFKPS